MKKLLLVSILLVAAGLYAGGYRYTAANGPTDDISAIRRACVGSDLDQDGKPEIIITDYRNGGMVHVYEVTGDNQIELVWSSPPLNSTYSYAVRCVKTGDLDADGNGEVIVFVGSYAGSPDAIEADSVGLFIFEWDGTTDNGYGTEPAAVRYITADDSLDKFYIPEFAVYDLDGDGRQEIIVPFNGKTTNSVGVTDDRFYVWSVAGQFPGLYTVNEELQLRRGVDFGGSPWSVKICDIDGDGTKEALCQTWNNITVFIIKATGTNTYEMSTPYTMTPSDDINIIGMGVGDVDGDNADEVYVGGYFTGYLYVIDGVTDAMAMDTTNFYLIGEFPPYTLLDFCVADMDGDGQPSIYFTTYGGVYEWEFTGTDPTNPDHYAQYGIIYRDLLVRSIGGGDMTIRGGMDLDGDELPELAVGYMGIGTDTIAGQYYPYQFLRVIEYDPNVMQIVHARGMELGTTVTIEGYVTAAGEFGPDIVYMEDQGAGIKLMGTGIADAYTVGEYYQVTGTLGVDGTMLILTPGTPTSVPVPPYPVIAMPKTLANFGDERYESMLAYVDSVWTDEHFPPEGSSAEIHIYQYRDTLIDTAIMYIDANTDIDGTTAPVGYFDLYAIIDQNPDSVYRLVPRELDDIVGIIETFPDISRFYLEPCEPNPARTEVKFSFTIKQPSHVRLVIYNAAGQCIRELMSGYMTAGRYTCVWDGTDARGNRVAGGVYFYRLESGKVTQTRKLIWLR